MIFTGLLDADPRLFFFLPWVVAKKALLQGIQGENHRWGRGSAFLMVVKYCVVTSLSVNIFRKRLDQMWTYVSPHSPNNTTFDWTLVDPIPYPPPSFHPFKFTVSIRHPIPCSVYMVYWCPLWPTFYHYGFYRSLTKDYHSQRMPWVIDCLSS